MNWTGQIVQILSIVLQSFILILLRKRALLLKFPFLTSYVAYDLARTILGAATISKPDVYFYVYWFTAPAEMILMILAVHESFRNTFRTFYLLRWFRVLLPATIAGALVYSAWKGYSAPPVQAGAAGSAIISAALTAQYITLAIAVLFFALAVLMHIPFRVLEFRFVLGFAISALAVAFGGAVRSVFGTKFGFLSETLPSVAYILALATWLSAVLRAEPLCVQGPLQEISRDEVISELRRRSHVIRSALRGK